MRLRAEFAAVAALLLAPPAAAQEQAPKTPTFGVDLELVNLTITVVDKAGSPVTGLRAEDFQVFEDGRPQKLVFFAQASEDKGEDRDALALDLGMLFDTSTSMLKEMKLSQEVAARFLEAIPRARDLLTVFFDHDIRVSRYDNESQQGLHDRLLAAEGLGWTALYDAIAVYISRAEDNPGGRKVLVMLTDGEDSRSKLSRGEAIQILRSSPVTVYAVAFHGASSAANFKHKPAYLFLREAASITGGNVFTPSASLDLPKIYEQILDELRAQYVVGFVSDNPKRDGKERKLKVELKRDGLKARHRQAYYAPEAGTP